MRHSELGRAIQRFSGSRARGERALVVAIIGYAARDALDGDTGAAEYLLGDNYQFHLELIGLPLDYLPAGLTRAGLVALVEAAASRAAARRATSPAGARPSRWPRGHKMLRVVTG